MAGEIKTKITVQVSKGGFSDIFNPAQVAIDQTGEGGGNPGTVEIGTSSEAIAFGDVTPGVVVMQNLDDTNFVTYGPDSTGAMVALGRLDPGEVALIKLAAGVTLRMLADTAACRVIVKGYDV